MDFPILAMRRALCPRKVVDILSASGLGKQKGVEIDRGALRRETGPSRERERRRADIARNELKCVARADLISTRRLAYAEDRGRGIEPEGFARSVALDAAYAITNSGVDGGATRGHLGAMLQSELHPQQQSAPNNAEKHHEKNGRR